uniref:NADH dehydrogenase subunit 6 n=1 Tax=Romanomermis culicivorax TaxID=13658 RepID=A0A915IVK8_ROMCU
MTTLVVVMTTTMITTTIATTHVLHHQIIINIIAIDQSPFSVQSHLSPTCFVLISFFALYCFLLVYLSAAQPLPVCYSTTGALKCSTTICPTTVVAGLILPSTSTHMLVGSSISVQME